MYGHLWLVPFLPFLGFLVLSFGGTKIPRRLAAIIGSGTVGLGALLTIIAGIHFLSSPPEGHFFDLKLWTWVNVGGFSPSIAFHFDALTFVFMFVITFVGFLIHVYSAEYMWEDEGYSRFFAYMNLFVFAMLTLVMADNLVLLYLGWEGVGLCSFLLIGFYYKENPNGAAARKAFIVTRVGDTAMALGLFLLIIHFNTLDIQTILTKAPSQWPEGSSIATWVSLLLLGGAMGKSAQVPLQTWLPDAMAGPSPVSALIHAATMVTSGVYLIARTHGIFELSPVAMMVVAITGTVTLVVAGFAAIAQSDIKRVLAYSTISQIGYMILALGVGAWAAGVFHFMIHAFFKALLFLGAGAVILALHHEQNMFKMGGLAKKLPVIFWTYLAGSGALAALPLITAGFYSKDQILWYTWSSAKGSHILWAAAYFGAFVTSIYTFRMVFITFFGKEKTHVHYQPGWTMKTPLVILGTLSVIGGFIELPHSMGHFTLFSDMLSHVLPAAVTGQETGNTELIFQVITAVTCLVGIYIAWVVWYKNPGPLYKFKLSPAGKSLHHFLFTGLGFDWFYDHVFVNPYIWLSKINKNDIIDKIYIGITNLTRYLHRIFKTTITGNLRWYVAGIALGVLVTLTIVLFL